MAEPVAAPALRVEGHDVVATGWWLTVAAIFDHQWREEDVHDPTALVGRIRAHRFNGRKADLFTFAERLPRTEPRFPYHTEWDSVAAIRLTTFDEWWRGVISTNARKNVRKAIKRGVTTRVVAFDDDLVRGIVRINNESPVRQGRRFSHYQESFEVVARKQATYPEQSAFIGAYYNDELVGFLKIVRVGKAASIMQLLTRTAHSDRRPANALIAAAVKRCAEDGMSHLIYGRFRYGKKVTGSLVEFKRRNGFEEALVPRYYVPLTAKGRICLQLGLHRGLAGVLPEPIQSALRALRRRWVEATVPARTSTTAR